MTLNFHPFAATLTLFVLGLGSTVNGEDTAAPPTVAVPVAPPATVAEPGVFSYTAPKGWTVATTEGATYSVCVGEAQDNKFTPNINVQMDTRNGAVALEDFVEKSKDNLSSMTNLSNLKVSEAVPFKTDSGLAGFRLEVSETVNDLNLTQVFYYFEGHKTGTKLIVTCSSLADHAKDLAPGFDASMKTFSNR